MDQIKLPGSVEITSSSSEKILHRGSDGHGLHISSELSDVQIEDVLFSSGSMSNISKVSIKGTGDALLLNIVAPQTLTENVFNVSAVNHSEPDFYMNNIGEMFVGSKGMSVDGPLTVAEEIRMKSMETTELIVDARGAFVDQPSSSLAKIDSSGVATGKVFSISAPSLTSGPAIEVVNQGNSLTTGSLIKLETGTIGGGTTNGVINIKANNMVDGMGIKLETANLQTGTGLEMTGNMELTTGHLVHVSTLSRDADLVMRLDANNMENGTVFKVESNDLFYGRGVQITSSGSQMVNDARLVDITASNQIEGTLLNVEGQSIESGVGFKLSSGSSLTSGHLFSVDSGGTATTGGIVSIRANSASSGKVLTMSTSGITHGTVMEFDTGNGNALQNSVSPIQNFIHNMSTDGWMNVSSDVKNLFEHDSVVILSWFDGSKQEKEYIVRKNNPGNSFYTYSLQLVDLVTRKPVFFPEGDVQRQSSISRVAGKIFNIKANKQSGGTLVGVSANMFSTGTVIDVDVGSALSSGKLLHLRRHLTWRKIP